MLFEIILIVTGTAIGAVVCYIILTKTRVSLSRYQEQINANTELQIKMSSMLTQQHVNDTCVSKSLHELLAEDLRHLKLKLEQKEIVINQLTAESEQRLTRTEVADNYVSKETNDLIIQKLNRAENDLKMANKTIQDLGNSNTRLTTENEHAHLKLKEFKAELVDLQQQSRLQFQNLANDILKEKGKDFSELNNKSMEGLLKPLQENLKTFQQKVEDTRKEDIADLTSLKKEIEALERLNFQLSDDAKKLTNALKTDTKIQGNWGEDRLRMILETEGMMKYVDFTSQAAYKDEDLEVNRKPDYILNLPGGKHLIIDSKVTLTSYINYFNCDDAVSKKDCLKQLTNSILNHIDQLAAKNYETLTGLNTPDFVCLFMWLEPALTVAVNENQDIIKRAMDKKIILLTPTTIMATVKMIDLLWKKENCVKNVEAIFRQCGQLYEKFVLFVEEFEKIGANLEAATISYQSGMSRLVNGARKGDTIVGRFENLKKLEAKTTKVMSPKLLNEISLLADEQVVDETTESVLS